MDKLKNYFIILLSAGSGKRMGLIGKSIPKSLFKIRNTTPLDLLIQKLQIRGAKEINIVLGFRYRKILDHLKTYTDINFRHTIIKNFNHTGSVWSLYKSYNLWKSQKKKNILMFHTDLIFSDKFLDNIINSRKGNIIGVKHNRLGKFKDSSFVVEVDKLMRVKNIGKTKEIKKPYGEIICINKFTNNTFSKLFYFLKSYFKYHSNNITWEYPMSLFSKNFKLYALKDQNFKWVNINTRKDLILAKKIAA